MNKNKVTFIFLLLVVYFFCFIETTANNLYEDREIHAEQSNSEQINLNRAAKERETSWIGSNAGTEIVEEANKTKLSFFPGSLRQKIVTQKGVVYNSRGTDNYLGIYAASGSLATYRPQIPLGNAWASANNSEGDVYQVVKNVQYFRRSDNQAIKAVSKDPKFPFEYEITLELDPIEGFYKTIKVTNLSSSNYNILVSEATELVSGMTAYSLGKNQGVFKRNDQDTASMLVRLGDLAGNPYGDFSNYVTGNYVDGWILGGFKSDPYGIGQESMYDEGDLISGSNSSFIYKSQPKNLGLNESITGKMYMYFGDPNPPELTLDNQDFNIYKGDEKISLTGSIFDKDSVQSSVYVEYPMDLIARKLKAIPIEHGVTKAVDYEIDVSMLQIGNYHIKTWAQDPVMTKSDISDLAVNVFDLTATPITKKILKGADFAFTPDELIKNVESVNPAISNIKKKTDTDKIGFDYAVVSLQDSIRTDKTTDISIPINVYGPNTTMDDTTNLALDAQEVWLSQGKVKSATDLNQLILSQINPTAWNMETGTSYKSEVTSHNVKVAMGTYQAEITAKNEKNQAIKKNVKVNVVEGIPMLKSEAQGQSLIVKLGESYKLSGTALDQDSQNYSVAYQLDDDEPVTILDQYDNSETYNKEVSFSASISMKKLTLGLHSVKLTIVDSEGNKSKDVDFQLNVKGELAFKEVPSTKIEFPTEKIPDVSKLIETVNPIEMIVEDYRGVGTNWKMVGTLVNEMEDSKNNQVLKNSLVFIDEHEVEKPFILNEGMVLARGETSNSIYEFPIKWEKKQGILLRIPLSAKKGSYEGVMNLTLVDAP
ncbi:MAG: hypothetical protein ACTIDE_10890 [Carnobacterium maltaromaticum]